MPEFGDGDTYILGFDTAFDNGYLTGLTAYYIDLDEDKLFPFTLKRIPEMTDSPSEHDQYEETVSDGHSSKKSDKSKKSSKKSDKSKKSSKKSSKSSHKSD